MFPPLKSIKFHYSWQKRDNRKKRGERGVPTAHNEKEKNRGARCVQGLASVFLVLVRARYVACLFLYLCFSSLEKGVETRTRVFAL